ncbi:unnamed protein product [Toxocara canis]|uniref:Dynamin_M domain-containing protein n=1 Tax=Toxocara canis TaxID=6265 RepID=A0A183UXW7_TOXCA|nr:unnamed protein product [Toxocara canis]
MGEFDLDELAKEIAAKLLMPLTSALSDKLQVAVQPVVDRLDKLIKLLWEIQSSATQCWVEPQLYSVMAKMMQMDRNEMDEKNKRAVFIGIPHATTEDATNEDEQMLREVITACDSRKLSESYAKGRITTRRHPDYQAGPKGSQPLKVTFEPLTYRDIFLRSLKRKLPSKMQSLPHPYVRRS